MDIREIAFCVDTINKGDDLYVGILEDFKWDDKIHCNIKYYIDNLSIERIDEVFKNLRGRLHESYKAFGSYSVSYVEPKVPILVRRHRNKYYNIDGERVYPS